MMHRLRTALASVVGVLAVTALAVMVGIVPIAEVRTNVVTFNQEVVRPLDELPTYKWQLASFTDENHPLILAPKDFADPGGVGEGVGSFTLKKIEYSATLGAFMRANANAPNHSNLQFEMSSRANQVFAADFSSYSARPPSAINGT